MGSKFEADYYYLVAPSFNDSVKNEFKNWNKDFPQSKFILISFDEIALKLSQQMITPQEIIDKLEDVKEELSYNVIGNRGAWDKLVKLIMDLNYNGVGSIEEATIIMRDGSVHGPRKPIK